MITTSACILLNGAKKRQINQNGCVKMICTGSTFEPVGKKSRQDETKATALYFQQKERDAPAIAPDF